MFAVGKRIIHAESTSLAEANFTHKWALHAPLMRNTSPKKATFRKGRRFLLFRYFY